MTGQDGRALRPLPRRLVPRPARGPRPCPPKRQRPATTRMTIAVGIVSFNYLILAADSQEGWGGPKRNTRKIEVAALKGRNKLRGRLAVTGAGDSDYLAYLKSRITQQSSSLVLSASGFEDSIEDVIQSEMHDFFGAHFVPLAHLESRDAQPELIVAARMRDRMGLWTTRGTTVRRVGVGGVAVGSGALWSRTVLDQDIASYLPSLHSATVTACYAIFSAKEHAEGCGNDTDVVSLGSDDGSLLQVAIPEEVRRAEEVFRKYDAMQKGTLRTLVGSPLRPIVSNQAELRLSAMREELSQINFYPPPSTSSKS